MLVCIGHGVAVDGHSYFVVLTIFINIMHVCFHIPIHRTQYAVPDKSVWNIRN